MNRVAKLEYYFLTLFFFIFSNATQAAEPLEIKLTGPKNLLVGERPNLQIEVTNVSDEPIEFVPPLDGSWYHWRYPYISVEVCDEMGKVYPTTLGGRCGNINPIVADNIHRLNPEEKKAFSIGWAFRKGSFEKPGEYSLILSYDLRAPNIDAWVIPGRFSNGEISPEVVNRLKRVPKRMLISKPLIINVHPVKTTMLERMIVNHFLLRDRSEFAFTADDLRLGRWRVRDIRQFSGYLSCIVEFVGDYTPLPRPKYITPGYWFKEGRYLFVPQYGKSKSRALHALPNDPQVSAFKLYLPHQAAIFARRHKWLGKGLGFSQR